MKRKYLEERYGNYFIFGTHENGNVDVSDGTNDVAVNQPIDVANRLIEQHTAMLDMIEALANRLQETEPDVFHGIYYCGP